MKKLIYITLLAFIFSSCSREFIQVFDTETTNTKSIDGFYIYETDTLKMTYEFWASKGVMSFSVYNKLDVPIYIDWKNSAFIYNSNKLNYWLDEQTSTLISYFGGYAYNGPIIRPGYTITQGVQSSTSKTIKPERITFIPPKSNYYRSQFYLMPVNYYKLDTNNVSKLILSRNDNPKKKTIVYEKTFTYSTSPLKFRNYIAFSMSENASTYFHIDNEFYLTSVKEMDYRHFHGKIVTNIEGESDYAKPSKKKTSFYLKINPTNSLEYRSRYGTSK